MKKLIQNKIIIYQTKTGAIELKGDFGHETIWATQAQIAEVFEVERSVITKHINNILKDKELSVDSVCAKIAHTATDGKTYTTQVYNLDVILAVGYRTNSTKAINFRQWATKTLREHITKGYTINKNHITKNYEMFLKAVDDVKSLLPGGDSVDTKSVLELVKMFASTWLSLDAYDKSDFPTIGATKKQVVFTSDELIFALAKLKDEIRSDIFGVERNRGSIEGIVGNIFQAFVDQDVYPTVEEKAAHLLYFMVKNHPFVDGNKRSGAFAFVWFLQKAKILNTSGMTPEALTALTLLVAESEAKNKDKMIGLILQLLLHVSR